MSSSRPKSSTLERTLLAFVAFALFVASYSFVVYGPWFPPALAPTWDRLFIAAIAYLQADFWTDAGWSLYRLTAGFLLASVFALPIALFASMSARGSAIISPLVSALRYVPPAALLPLIVILAGIGDSSKILVIAIACFFVLVPSIVDYIEKIPTNLLQVARTMGFRGLSYARRIIWPYALPGIWRALRASMGVAWTYVVVSELVNASNGIGFRIIKSQRFLQLDTIVVALVCIGIIGLLLDMFMRVSHEKFFPWDKDEQH